MGWFGTTSTIGFAVGMMLGGVLTGSAGWEWVMFINVPIGLAVIGLSGVALPAGRAAGASGGFDVPGAVLITGASACLVYALSDAERSGWTSPQTLGLLAANAPVVFLGERLSGKVDLSKARFVAALLFALFGGWVLAMGVGG